MPTIITGDWHFSEEPRDVYRFKTMRTLRRIIKEQNADLLIVLGDICESKDRHSSNLVNAVVTEFHKFAKLCPVVILKGNHDYQAEDAPFWGFLRRIPGITYIPTPTYGINLPITLHPKLGRVLFLNHSINYKKDWASFDLSAYDTIFAHQTFAGALNESGHRMDGVPVDIFSPWTTIVSGDVHAPQRLNNLFYVGAPYTVDFGNDYEPRVLLFDKTFESIPVPGPQKRLVEEDGFEDTKRALKKLNEGDIVKVRMHYSPGADQYSWQEIKDAVRNWCEDYKLHLEKIEPIVKHRASRKIEKRTPKTDHELLDLYGKSRRINDRLMKTGHWIIDQ